jgi:hypothetical protein
MKHAENDTAEESNRATKTMKIINIAMCAGIGKSRESGLQYSFLLPLISLTPNLRSDLTKVHTLSTSASVL